jgi:tetratricopeptide (TPR) repeat protein
MKANYLVETGLWNTSIADTKINLDKINISKKALYRFCDAMKAYHNEDIEALKAIIVQMESERQEVTTLMAEEGVPMCNANGPYSKYANKLDINQAHVMEMELRALYANMQGKAEVAENWFKEAIELEENTSYAYGPPAIAQPSFELYANWLLEQERYEEANEQFQKSLERGPKRLLALKGQLAVAKAQKNASAIDKIQETIAGILKNKEQLSSI